jgi:CP family cyanate transporter-like MFS transporter
MDAFPDRPQRKNSLGIAAGGGDYLTLRALLLRHPGWSVAAVLLIAFNLRPAITTVALFIGDIRTDFGLSAFGISLLTMAPVVCLGLFAPLAPPLVRRFGAEAVVMASLVGLAIGCVVRSFAVVPLFLGTVIIGASMCLLGVLGPVIVKRDFPHRIGLMMGFYTMLVCLGPALAAVTAVPLRHALRNSWELVLVFWALPALIAAVVFIPQLFRHTKPHGVASAHLRGMLRDPLAWQVTAFFALISSLAYAVFNWGPAMLQARGLDAAASGVVISFCYLAQMATGLLAPIVAGRHKDQRLVIAIVSLLTIAGLLGFVFAPVWSLTLFSVVLGLGQGGAFGVALLLFVLRARNSQAATQLSALAQTVGYVASGLIGPFAVGLLYEWSGSWPVVAVFYSAVGIASLLAGLGAGRDRLVGTPVAVVAPAVARP